MKITAVNVSRKLVFGPGVDGVRPYPIDEKCEITLDGVKVTLDKIKAGDEATLSGQPATTLIASRPAKA